MKPKKKESSMAKKLTKCEYCGKKFKSIKSHLIHCKVYIDKAKEYERANASQNIVRGEGRTLGIQEAKQEQTFRGKDALIQLTECIAKMNNALAGIVSEW